VPRASGSCASISSSFRVTALGPQWRSRVEIVASDFHARRESKHENRSSEKAKSTLDRMPDMSALGFFYTGMAAPTMAEGLSRKKAGVNQV